MRRQFTGLQSNPILGIQVLVGDKIPAYVEWCEFTQNPTNKDILIAKDSEEEKGMDVSTNGTKLFSEKLYFICEI